MLYVGHEPRQLINLSYPLLGYRESKQASRTQLRPLAQKSPLTNYGPIILSLIAVMFFQSEAYASPKFCPALKSTASTLSSAGVSAMTGAHVSLRRIRVGPAHPLLSIASKPAPGKSRSPATVGCAEAQASPTPDGSG
jgi:hypothetical protein